MADNLTVSEFRARFPEFDSASDSEVQSFINDTLCSFDQSRWDCFYKRGHSLYVAHLLSLRSQQSEGNSGTSGMDSVQNEAADGVSVSYATYTPSNSNESFFMGTSYGRAYIMLLRSGGIGGIAICSG